MPLVVVITNPHGATVITGDREVIWAMYGDPVVRMTISKETGAAVGDAVFTVDRNGKLRGDHQYISAVAFVRTHIRLTDVPAEVAATDTYQTVDVFKTLSPSAVPLPDVFFDGPHDRLFDYDPAEEAYRQVRP